MTIRPTPCICGCGKSLRRAKSIPMCKTAADRAHRIFRASVRGADAALYVRAFNQFYGNPENVTAALTAA